MNVVNTSPYYLGKSTYSDVTMHIYSDYHIPILSFTDDEGDAQLEVTCISDSTLTFSLATDQSEIIISPKTTESGDHTL